MGEPLVRIGLSATQRPIEKVARFLVGRSASCAIIDSGHRREMDVAIELPGAPLEAVMSNEVWEEVYRRLAELVEAHRTTLIFVNTRRLAERTAHHLGDLIGKKHRRPSRQLVAGDEAVSGPKILAGLIEQVEGFPAPAAAVVSSPATGCCTTAAYRSPPWSAATSRSSSSSKPWRCRLRNETSGTEIFCTPCRRAMSMNRLTCRAVAGDACPSAVSLLYMVFLLFRVRITAADPRRVAAKPSRAASCGGAQMCWE